MRKSVYIVIPVHNQCKRTLLCLDNLAKNAVTEWASIVVVDDGSADGTAEEIKKYYPDVHLLYGDGNLWWTGGIVKGMQYAINSGAEFIVWLNDDCRPQKGALERLVENSALLSCISVAQAFTPTGYIYSGKKKTLFSHHELFCPKNQMMKCDFFSGNCVCIPIAAVNLIGFPDQHSFPHGYSDHDYGLRATKANIPCFIVGSSICDNDDNIIPQKKSWLLNDVDMLAIWRKEFLSPYGVYAFKAYFIYKYRHWNIWGLLSYPLPYLRYILICIIRILLPNIILVNIYGNRSNAFKIARFYRKDDKP